MKQKKKFKLLRTIRNIGISIVAIVFMWVLIHQGLVVYEKNKYQPIGQLVEIDGNNMHVYTKGEGENTIVLLSGLGTAAPALDFEPLVNEMAKNHKVVVVEPFGYGWSETTSKERTVENIVEELRGALKKSNIEGPYILMPHSISGIYSMYYANAYPDEVKAVIGIDPTLPKQPQYFNETVPAMPSFFSVVAPIGIARVAINIAPADYLPIADEGTYSEDNLKMTKVISAWEGYNKNVVAETNGINNNIDKTVDMSFPLELPVMIFTSKADKVTEEGKSNVTFYETEIDQLNTNKLVILEGHHYLHWTRYEEMSEDVNNFIAIFN